MKLSEKEFKNIALIAGMAPENKGFYAKQGKKKRTIFKSHNQTWVMSGSHDHYTTRELAAGK